MNNAAERPAVPERRASELSPEEVQQGIEFRKNALKSADVDLGSIARTAPALSTSPKQAVPIVADAEVRTYNSMLHGTNVDVWLLVQTNV